MRKLNYIYISLIAIVVSLMASSCDEYFDIEPNAKNQEFTVNGVSFEMVFVEGGSFIMGATFEQGGDAEGDEKPAHQVTLSDYMIGKTEVTQELWQAVMGSNPSSFKGDNLPVERVSWNDCQEFIEKLNIATKDIRPKGMVFQLPTEAEWEYAARGGNHTKGFKYSGSNNIDNVAWYDSNSSSKTHTVATKSANELGLYDMSGNVWEWCSDWYGDHSTGSQTNPKGPTSGSFRVFRGGSWNGGVGYCRVSYRSNDNPDYGSYGLGLRLALADGEEPEMPNEPTEPEFEYKTYTINGVSFDMVSVVGGTFTMGATSEQGSDADSDEKPTHNVTLSDYMIGKTEVTQELWEAVMGSNPSDFKGNNLPVENVSWYDCQEFIEKLNIATKDIRPKGLVFQLPTEAEWEYAARGGNKSKGYKYSGSNDIGSVAWYTSTNDIGTEPVATKAPNELGLYDMSGNVDEWCSDWYGDYSSGSQTNPKGPSSGSERVVRGGSWHSGARGCRVSGRGGIYPNWVFPDLGLRLALAEGEEPETPDEPTEPKFEYETYTVKGVSFDMVSVAGGTFTMGATSEQGSDADSDAKPTHNVTLSDFMIGKTEVTQELWQAVMGSNPSDFKGNNLPVENVSWNDCQEFIKKLNSLTGLQFRLPTEAEWEYAARGGNKSKGYKYSGSNDIGSVAWYWYNSSPKTHAVATKSPNELGLYDMSGNVDEWCSDWYGDYSSGSQTNPKGPSSGSERVVRGGSWFSSGWTCRVSNRLSNTPDERNNYLGLRLALAEGEEPETPDEPTEPEFEYKTYKVKGISFDMVSVAGGTFTMGATSEQGSDADNDEYPTHQVTLSDFMIGKTEVTQELWQAVMGSNPSYFSGNNLPVEKVSWNDCQEFIKKLNSLTGLQFRLPTEAEWEYAARGGNKSKGYKYSGSNDIGSVAWYSEHILLKTHTVATKSANELGLYDMSGNVYEWCSDWYGDYSSGSQTNPKGPYSGSFRVYRGGGWFNHEGYCRVSDRSRGNPDDRDDDLGLRLAL